MFDGPGFDEARHQANLVDDYLRRHGPWEPLKEMEYTTMPAVAKKLSNRWQPLDESSFLADVCKGESRPALALIPLARLPIL